MDVVRTLIGVDGFQIHHMADDVIFIGDAVAAQHVAGLARNIQGFAAIVAFEQGNSFRRGDSR